MGVTSSSSVGKQSQLLLQPTEVELGIQVKVGFDKKENGKKYPAERLALKKRPNQTDRSGSFSLQVTQTADSNITLKEQPFFVFVKTPTQPQLNST